MLNPSTFAGRTAWSLILVLGLGIIACETPVDSEIEVGHRIQLTQNLHREGEQVDALASAERIAAKLAQLKNVERVETKLMDSLGGSPNIELFLVGNDVPKDEIENILSRMETELDLSVTTETVVGEIHEKFRHRFKRALLGEELHGKSAVEIHEQLRVHLEEFGIEEGEIIRAEIHQDESGQEHSVFEIQEEGEDGLLLELKHEQDD
jgi:hypothetical protein